MKRREIIMRVASANRLGMCHVSRLVVQRILGHRNKAAIARALADRFPELRSRMPRVRKLWTTEDERMHIFDALALAVVVMPPDDPPAK